MPLDRTEPLPLFACPDWWDKIQRGETPIADVPVNEARASRALAFFKRLRLPDVAGNPPLSEACGDWFLDIVRVFFGSEDPVSKERLVWELLCLVPKKNSKSTYSAALGLTALYLEETTYGQMLLIGPTQNISARCFSQAEAMIELDPDLQAIFHVQAVTKTIQRLKTKTELEVKTFDTGIITGEIPLLTIVDELHELGKKPKAAKVMQQIRGGGITQTGGQILFITTQSDGRPTGVWKRELAKARAIRDGEGSKRPLMLPVLYEFPADLQRNEEFWRDKNNWSLLQPNLGRSVNWHRLVADYQENGASDRETEQIWVSQHLNVEIGVGLKNDGWTGLTFWEEATVADLTLDELIRRSDVITIGIDPGGQDDLLAISFLGREKVSKRWLHVAYHWADRIVLERRKAIAPQLLDFEKDGELTLVGDLETEAYSKLAELCCRVRDTGLLPAEGGVGVDAAGKAANLAADALEEAGFDMDRDLVAVSQGFRLSNIAATVAIKLKNKSFLHAGQAIMAWCVENVKMHVSGNAEYPSKADSGIGKIDGVMSLLDAAELMGRHPEAGGRGLDDFLERPVIAA